MLKKRLIGIVTVKNGLAVQSFGYSRYLPLGRPEIIVQTLDRWGVDEILVQCIDRTIAESGPDFNILDKICRMGITTPLIYAGGIRNVMDAKNVIKNGADRVMVDFVLHHDPAIVKNIALELGTQALIANILIRNLEEVSLMLNYRSGEEKPLAESITCLPIDWVSEILITDWLNEGISGAFSLDVLKIISLIKKPVICFGGISTVEQIKNLLDISEVVAVGIGNFLNYKEHALQLFKNKIVGASIRPSYYEIHRY